ncbi:MAG: bifunctional folylpolyglutamate synthase/dihydrofolate synthase [Phycisphaerales bacterium]|nr:bifunctional folylpolyglutamate synthase/dihydrofolate synthase [Phycisphaerales bacterium]
MHTQIRNSFDPYQYLNQLPNFERTVPQRISPATFKLERMRTLLSSLGNPQNTLTLIHVAGSKGKGSICEMTASALQGCGYTVGVFTSPHLVSPRERIRINDAMIDESSFADVLARVARATEKHRLTRENTTYFEVMTAAGFLYFAEQAVDIAVIEVGLGGTLDSTNVIQPAVCIIGALYLEHAAILGSTLEAIACEKAGVIKPKVPVVTLDHPPSVMEVIRKKAEAADAPLHVLRDTIPFSWRVSANANGQPQTVINLACPTISLEHIPVPLAGDHQAVNCALALTAISLLKGNDFSFSEPALVEGLSRTMHQGRMELICQKPRVLIDGAHNPESIECLVKTLALHHTYDSLHVVFGCASDKDIRGMLAHVATVADKVVFTQADSSRAVDPNLLLQHWNELTDRPAQVAATVPDALRDAASVCTPDDLICVTGSFHLVGQAKEHVCSRLSAAQAGPQ